MKTDVREAVVQKLPKCDFCEKNARYDAKTFQGPWANMCHYHWIENAQYKTLGEGKGQNLILPDEVI